MEFASCAVPAAPVRASAAHTAEMVNQLLFGEAVRVLETIEGQWCHVEGLTDGYQGWVHHLQLRPCEEASARTHSDFVVLPNGATTVIQTAAGTLHLPFAASLPLWNGKEGRNGDISFSYQGKEAIKPKHLDWSASDFQGIREYWLNAPYLWGGRTLMGIDCSGFTQVVMKTRGVFLPRDASQQAAQGTLVDFQQEATLGDLAFFDDAEGRIYHVGLILDSGHIMHAYGKVRIDKWDHAGIINGDTGERTHQLRIIKRYL